MSQKPFPDAAVATILRHCEDEAALLSRLQHLAETMTAGGPRSPSLLNCQTEVTSVMEEWTRVEQQRQGLRSQLAQFFGCAVEDFRLSMIQPENPHVRQQLVTGRQRLRAQARQTRAQMDSARRTLQGWHQLTSDVLSVVLDTPRSAERYGADGMRVTSHMPGGIDVRS